MINRYIYIAGPYRGKTHDYRSYFEIDRNIVQAEQAFATLAQAGVGAFCPHTHSAHFEIKAPDATPEYWYELDIYFLMHCDAILMLPGYQNSSGSMKELGLMQKWDKPVFFDVDAAIEWAMQPKENWEYGRIGG